MVALIIVQLSDFPEAAINPGRTRVLFAQFRRWLNVVIRSFFECAKCCEYINSIVVDTNRGPIVNPAQQQLKQQRQSSMNDHYHTCGVRGPEDDSVVGGITWMLLHGSLHLNSSPSCWVLHHLHQAMQCLRGRFAVNTKSNARIAKKNGKLQQLLLRWDDPLFLGKSEILTNTEVANDHWTLIVWHGSVKVGNHWSRTCCEDHNSQVNATRSCIQMLLIEKPGIMMIIISCYPPLICVVFDSTVCRLCSCGVGERWCCCWWCCEYRNWGISNK